jgi:predicted RNase H-like nuclease (RuvC/YqgF family)
LAKEISATVADEEKLSTLRTRIEADYSAKSVYETYSSVLENALFRPCPEYTAFFNEVKLTINSGDPATIITHSMAATMARHFTNPLVFNTFLQSYTEAGQQRNVLALQTSLNASTAKLASYEQEVHTLTDAFQSLDRHHSSALYAINGRMIDLNDRIDKLFKSNADLKRRLTSLEKTIEKKNHQIAALQTSNSWRIGRFVTYLPRRIKRLIKQFVK